jgi:hypothetical protein
MKNRQGSYKKVLIAEGLLAPSRSTLIKNIDALTTSELSSFEFCTLYILLFLRIRHPKNWLQKKTQFTASSNEKKLLDIIPLEFDLTEWEKSKLQDISAVDLFRYFNLKGIPLAVNRTMINWAEGAWNIVRLTAKGIPFKLKCLKRSMALMSCSLLFSHSVRSNSEGMISSNFFSLELAVN